MSGKVQIGAKLPDGFCEHEVCDCSFCGKPLHYGHVGDDEEILVHETPSCDEFRICDDVSQFAMLTALKEQSDLGQLVRN